MAKNALKMGVNTQFQALTPKSKQNRSNAATTNPIISKFERQVKTNNNTSWAVYHFPTSNPAWRTAAFLTSHLSH